MLERRKRAGQAPPALTLVENPDILAGLAADRPRAGQVIVGFAAETGDAEGDVLHHGRAKARRKGADLLAVNEVGAAAGFGDVGNTITVLDANGEVRGSSDYDARVWSIQICRSCGLQEEVSIKQL